MDIYELENDLVKERCSVRLRDGTVLVIDPNRFSVELELKYTAFRQSEAQLIEEGKVEAAREQLVQIVADILLPDNPEWTADVIRRRLSTQTLGRIFGFFGSAALQRLPEPGEWNTIFQRGSANPVTLAAPVKTKRRSRAA